MFLVASGADVLIDKEKVASGFKQIWTDENGRMVLNHGFEKWNLTLRKPMASFVAAKPEHIDQI